MAESIDQAEEERVKQKEAELEARRILMSRAPAERSGQPVDRSEGEAAAGEQPEPNSDTSDAPETESD